MKSKKIKLEHLRLCSHDLETNLTHRSPVVKPSTRLLPVTANQQFPTGVGADNRRPHVLYHNNSGSYHFVFYMQTSHITNHSTHITSAMAKCLNPMDFFPSCFPFYLPSNYPSLIKHFLTSDQILDANNTSQALE